MVHQSYEQWIILLIVSIYVTYHPQKVVLSTMHQNNSLKN